MSNRTSRSRDKEVTDNADGNHTLSDFSSDTTETYSSDSSEDESARTHDSLSAEATETMQRIEAHLLDVVNDTGYLSSRDIAGALRTVDTRTVAALLHDVDERSEQVSIEKWSQANWKVEVLDGA